MLALIVDDNEQNARLARDVLRAGGFRTLEAATGTEAIELAAAELPDVILMDLRLPDMDGVDAARALAAGVAAQIPIVAMSAVRFEDGGGWARAAGFAGHLEKPIDVRAFPSQVRRYCARAVPTPR